MLKVSVATEKTNGFDIFEECSALVLFARRGPLTLLEPQSSSGDKPVKFQVVLSPNGTAVLKGLIKQL